MYTFCPCLLHINLDNYRLLLYHLTVIRHIPQGPNVCTVKCYERGNLFPYSLSALYEEGWSNFLEKQIENINYGIKY